MEQTDTYCNIRAERYRISRYQAPYKNLSVPNSCAYHLRGNRSAIPAVSRKKISQTKDATYEPEQGLLRRGLIINQFHRPRAPFRSFQGLNLIHNRNLLCHRIPLHQFNRYSLILTCRCTKNLSKPSFAYGDHIDLQPSHECIFTIMFPIRR